MEQRAGPPPHSAANLPHNADSSPPSTPNSTSAEQSNLELSLEKDLVKETDIEKGAPAESITSHHVEEVAAIDADPNIVFWDGPNDPENPMNWSFYRRWGTVSLVSIITFVTPLASSMFAPGIPQVMKTFNSTNTMLSSFMLSVYVLGFAFGPIFFAPLSEMYGRLPVYHTCTLFFLIFTIAAAVSTNMDMFIVFRFLMGTFGGAPVVLGGGTIADLISIEQRGTAMTVWMMGPTIGPCIGPVLGGVFTQEKGWRWNFWFVAIVTGAVLVLSVLVMRETSGTILLERKTRRLREETGNPNLRSKLDKGLTPKQLFWFSIIRPLKMLFLSPICFFMSLYMALTYAYLYILFTTFTTVYEQQYGWHGVVTGLSFLGIGLGSFTSQIAFTYWGNRKVKKHVAKGDFKPEHRLHIMAQWCLAMPIGLFWYGWSVQAKTHFIVPILGSAVVGWGMLMNFNPANTYLVDVFTVHAASAMAAATILRSLAAALIPLSSRKMYAALGYGWGNSLLAFISLGLAPMPFLFIRYGERIRAAEKVNL